jgi:Na+/proline symporter
VVYAVFLVKRVLYSFLLTETMATYVGVSLLGGIIWQRANRWGALASLAVSMAVNFGMYRLRGQRLDHWDPVVFGAALVAGVAALIVVSLATRPEPATCVKAFFENLGTPATDPGLRGRALLIPNLLHLRQGAQGESLIDAYRVDLTGLATGTLIAVGMVAAVWLLFRF